MIKVYDLLYTVRLLIRKSKVVRTNRLIRIAFKSMYLHRSFLASFTRHSCIFLESDKKTLWGMKNGRLVRIKCLLMHKCLQRYTYAWYVYYFDTIRLLDAYHTNSVHHLYSRHLVRTYCLIRISNGWCKLGIW